MTWANTFNALAEQIVIWRCGHGFHTPADLTSEPARDLMLGKLMLVCSEVAEAAEAVRKNDVVNFREEIADAIIRLLDIGGTTHMDIDAELAAKMEKNNQRPHKHGKMCSL